MVPCAAGSATAPTWRIGLSGYGCPGNGRDLEIDHINRRPWDNRFSNLRHVTKYQNQRNQALHRNNKSGLRRGVLAPQVGQIPGPHRAQVPWRVPQPSCRPSLPAPLPTNSMGTPPGMGARGCYRTRKGSVMNKRRIAEEETKRNERRELRRHSQGWSIGARQPCLCAMALLVLISYRTSVARPWPHGKLRMRSRAGSG